MATKDTRYMQILACVDNDAPASIGRIARGVGLRKTPYLRGLVSDLVASGDLLMTEHVFDNGTLGYLYVRPWQVSAE